MQYKIGLFIIMLVLLIFWLDFFTISWSYFFLDTIFYPIDSLTNFFSQSLYLHLRDILTLLFWYQLYSKVFLLWVFIIWVILWALIWEIVNKNFNITDQNIRLSNILLWVTFIALNPFSYERFITQTSTLLWIYIVLLWLALLIIFFLGKKTILLYLSSICFGISLAIFPHAIIFLSIIWIATIIFFPRSITVKQFIKAFLIMMSINVNWIIWSFFLKTNNNLSQIHTFDFQNVEVFQSNGLPWMSIEATSLLLYWFWGERYKHIYTPELVNDKWYIAWIIILLIISIWIYSSYKKNKKKILFILSIWIVWYFLSLWLSSPLSRELSIFLYNNIPYYIGLREPQKLIWLVLFWYTYFFLSWVSFISINLHSNRFHWYLNKIIFNQYIWFIILFLFIVSWSPNVLFSYNNQLRITDYPEDYFKAKTIIENVDKDYTNEKYVVFPWHSYIKCNWTNNIIANPSVRFFWNNNILQSDNIEIWTLYSNSTKKDSLIIESFLKDQNYTKLKNIWITNIIFLSKCADYKRYNFLHNSELLEMKYYWKDIIIYNIK